MIKILKDFIFKPTLFHPTFHLPNICQLPLHIKENQIKHLVFDKDDTLTHLHEFEVTQQIKQTLQQLKSMNISMSIVSNSIKFSDSIPRDNIEGIEILRTISKKPFNGEQIYDLVRAQHTQINRQQICIVGDRLMTDIYLANINGFKSGLVPPLQKSSFEKHGVAVYVLRKIEDIFIAGHQQ